MKMNRRTFLKGGAVAGGAALLGGLAGCSSSGKSATTKGSDTSFPKGTTEQDFKNSVVELNKVTSFSEEKTFDIVVVGAGTAGVPAVYAALEEGVRVACIQKESAPVANGNGSSGVIHEESNEVGKLQYMQAWRKAGGYRMNRDLLEQWVECSGEATMWMMKKGVEVGFDPETAITRNTYDENSYCSVVRNNFGPKPKNNTTIMTLLAEAAAKEGAEFFYSTPAVQLVQSDDGAVTGVIGKKGSSYIKFNASKAVIIAAGDYQNNESMVERYSPDVVRFARKQANKTGDGLLLSMTAGAAMVPVNHAKTMHDMDAAPMFLTASPFMALNEKGERFMNEEIPMESWDLSLKERDSSVDDPGRFVRVFDNDYVAKYNSKVPLSALEQYIPGFLEKPVGVYEGLTDTHRADTLEELAPMVDIPVEALKKSVQEWNAACAKGVDEKFGVSKEKMKPIDTPPYWATRQWIRCSAINAGVTVNKYSQVITNEGKVVKGLYSVGSGAGNVCGGLEWNLYQGGLCCGSYITNGRYAAIHAVKGAWKPSKPVLHEEMKSRWAKPSTTTGGPLESK